MTRYVGKLGTSSPLAIAERAIGAAEEMSQTSRAKFALYIDERERIHVLPCAKRVLPLHGWIATFNRKSDPDWLEEEIKAMAA